MVRKAIFAVLLIAMMTVAIGCVQEAPSAAPQTGEQPAPEQAPNQIVAEQIEEEAVPPVAEEPATQARVIKLTGENFKFVMDGVDNPDIIVKQGELVRIEFTSTSGFHDWVVDEFNAATEKVRDGGSTFVEFTADQVGTFEYYCSVGQHRANGMKGNLIVK